MLAQAIPVRSRRVALRRAVQLECSVHSPLWDGAACYLATDVSPHGLWLSTDLALDVGERLMLSFRPPRWPEWCWPVTAFGEVVRVNLARRRADARRPAGMAVRFTELDPVAREEMALLLRGVPPPLPHGQVAAACDELLQSLTLEDGKRFELRAEGALLTGGRKLAPLLGAAAAPVALGARPRPRRRRARERARDITGRPRRARAKPQRPKLRLVG